MMDGLHSIPATDGQNNNNNKLEVLGGRLAPGWTTEMIPHLKI